jgi:hypothetical protein
MGVGWNHVGGIGRDSEWNRDEMGFSMESWGWEGLGNLANILGPRRGDLTPGAVGEPWVAE